MKKIYSLTGLLLLCSVMILAQSPSNRTTKTIVADVLAQMPAQQGSQYDNQMKDLASTGEEGILQLVKMINPPGKGSNDNVEYALNGLSSYVSADGQETARLVTANTYIKALDLVTDREIKAFLIRQLQIVGKDESVTKLSSYLNDESLSGPACRALAAIGSPSSSKALLNALSTASNDRSKKDIIEAIAEIQVPESEGALKALIGAGDDNMQKTVLYALSRVGTKASLPELATAAEKAGFTMEKRGANEAYIALIKRVLAQDNMKDAEKAANDLMKKAQKAGQDQTRAAALQILMEVKPESALKLLQIALKDPSLNYRNYALTSALDYADNKIVTELLKSLKKATPEVKFDILNAFIRMCEMPQNRAYLAAHGTDIFIEQLADNNIQVKQAAAEILGKIGGGKSVVALVNQLKNSDEQTVQITKDALGYTKGDIGAIIAPAIANASEAGKIASLQLLGDRKASTHLNIVLDQINSGTSAVKEAAYSVLKDVVSSENLSTLYTLLEKAQNNEVAAVQQAIVVAIKNSPKEKQFELISAQMNKADNSKQYLYYPVLATTGLSKALNLIVDRFKKEGGSSKDAAFQALLDWRGREVADQLYTICKDASASSYFERALNRYIQLASTSQLTGENRRIFLTNALAIAKTDAQKNEILKQIGQTGSYLGMLLAGDYLDQTALQQSAAGAVMNIALNNKEYTGKNIEQLLNKVVSVLNNPDAEYQKEAIRKHLNEMPKEEGFVSIYNEKDLIGWQGIVENPIARGKMKSSELAKRQAKADEVAKAHWIPQGKILMFDGTGGDNLCTVKKYGDFEMYVDWNLDPAGPEADAGIYLRGTPQVQIWDIARVNVGAQVGSGGLYNNQKNPSIPLKVADNKLGEWNTFYIKMVGDRVTVKLNGELVVDNVMLENFWDRSLPIFPEEQIELQAHGSKVYYRNIYVKELERPKPFELSAQEKKEGYKMLFDGTNMQQWTGNTVDYALEDGCISLNPKGGHGGNLYTKDEFGNFIFRFEFQLTPAANNGLGIRTPLEGDAAYVGMELQILDNEAPVYKDLAPYQYHGSVYGIIPSKRGCLKPTGEWNYQEVIANGDNIKITLNGTVILDGNIREATKNGTPDKQKHPGLFNEKGHIGFLGHGSPVKFKNIRIKELK
ncbi:MAG: family 16 glycoside hydrolase [Dysgonomonas sp.]